MLALILETTWRRSKGEGERRVTQYYDPPKQIIDVKTRAKLCESLFIKYYSNMFPSFQNTLFLLRTLFSLMFS